MLSLTRYEIREEKKDDLMRLSKLFLSTTLRQAKQISRVKQTKTLTQIKQTET